MNEQSASRIVEKGDRLVEHWAVAGIEAFLSVRVAGPVGDWADSDPTLEVKPEIRIRPLRLIVSGSGLGIGEKAETGDEILIQTHFFL